MPRVATPCLPATDAAWRNTVALLSVKAVAPRKTVASMKKTVAAMKETGALASNTLVSVSVRVV